MICRQCGWDNETGAAFCSGCGAAIAPQSQAPQAPAAPPTRASSGRAGKRGLILLLALVVVLGVGGVLVGTLVVYPAREKAKIVAAYKDIEQAADGEDLEALSACTTGAAKSDVDAIANGLRVFRALVPVTVDLDVTIKPQQVRVHGKSADASVTFDATWSATAAGQRMGGESGEVTETHTWKRVDGEWKLEDWGPNGFVSGLAAKLPSL